MVQLTCDPHYLSDTCNDNTYRDGAVCKGREGSSSCNDSTFEDGAHCKGGEVGSCVHNTFDNAKATYSADSTFDNSSMCIDCSGQNQFTNGSGCKGQSSDKCSNSVFSSGSFCYANTRDSCLNNDYSNGGYCVGSYCPTGTTYPELYGNTVPSGTTIYCVDKKCETLTFETGAYCYGSQCLRQYQDPSITQDPFSF